MNRMREVARAAIRRAARASEREAGQGLAEYALILGFVAVVCIGALSVLGNTIASSEAWTIP